MFIRDLNLTNTGQPNEGETILREAVKMRTDSLPKEHFWVALANDALGECLTIQGRYDEAEPLLLQSYESLKSSQGATNPRTRLALRRASSRSMTIGENSIQQTRIETNLTKPSSKFSQRSGEPASQQDSTK